MINFYKNLVMAGGFLYVINFGAGVLQLRRRRTGALGKALYLPA